MSETKNTQTKFETKKDVKNKKVVTMPDPVHFNSLIQFAAVIFVILVLAVFFIKIYGLHAFFSKICQFLTFQWFFKLIIFFRK